MTHKSIIIPLPRHLYSDRQYWRVQKIKRLTMITCAMLRMAGSTLYGSTLLVSDVRDNDHW